MHTFVASSKLGLSAKLLCIVPIVIAGSSGLLGSNLFKKRLVADENQYLQKPLPVKFESFEKSFDTQKIKSYQDAVNLKPSECFKSFFPGAPFKKPRESHVRDVDAPKHQGTVPSLTTYPLTGSKVGCNVSKIVHIKTTNAFVYRLETTVKNEDTGFVLSAVSTNMKEAGKGDYEFWLMFLKKSDKKWKVMSGLSLMGQWDKTGAREDKKKRIYDKFLYVKPTPGMQYSTWSLSVPHDKIDKLPDQDLGPKETELCTKDVSTTNCYRNHMAKIWVYDLDGGIPGERHPPFGQNSHALYVLRKHFNPTETNTQVNVPFLKDAQLLDKGRWMPVSEYCKESRYSENLEDLKHTVKSLCFTHREKFGL